MFVEVYIHAAVPLSETVTPDAKYNHHHHLSETEGGVMTTVSTFLKQLLHVPEHCRLCY